jgi:hypothetical protein
VVKGGGLDPGAGAILRSLFEDRNQADYRFLEAPPETAESAISRAAQFIEPVKDWLEER